MAYAKETEVPAEKSRSELEKILVRYGADAYMYGYEETRARIQFRARGRYIRFDLPLPNRKSRAVTHTPERDLERSPAAKAAAYDQLVRSRWRALLLVVKAKLEAVEAGIVTFEDEFLAHTVLPDNSTVGEWLEPQLAVAYSGGNMPRLLPGPSKS